MNDPTQLEPYQLPDNFNQKRYKDMSDFGVIWIPEDKPTAKTLWKTYKTAEGAREAASQLNKTHCGMLAKYGVAKMIFTAVKFIKPNNWKF